MSTSQLENCDPAAGAAQAPRDWPWRPEWQPLRERLAGEVRPFHPGRNVQWSFV
jgi:hypothetical protein